MPVKTKLLHHWSTWSFRIWANPKISLWFNAKTIFLWACSLIITKQKIINNQNMSEFCSLNLLQGARPDVQ